MKADESKQAFGSAVFAGSCVEQKHIRKPQGNIKKANSMATNSTVIMYSKSSCVQCSATDRAFKKRSINVQVIDIEKDSAARSYVMELGYRQLPVVVAGEKHWAGFRPDMISQVA